MPISSSCRARKRPSPTSQRCAPAAGTSTSRRMRGAAAWCSASAAATRCWAARRRPDGIEGPPARSTGSGCSTSRRDCAGDKMLLRSRPAPAPPTGTAVRGYEMHVGRTTGARLRAADARLRGRPDDGATSADGRVIGCYVHGLFADDAQRGRLAAPPRRRDARTRTTRRWSSRRSTRWPIIWSAISTAMRCSRQPRSRAHIATSRASDRDHAGLQHAGAR